MIRKNQLPALLAAMVMIGSVNAADMSDKELGLLLGGAFGSDRLVGSKDGDVNPLIGFRYGQKLGSDFNFFSDFTYVPYKGNLSTVGDSKVWTLRAGAEWLLFKEPKYNWFAAFSAGLINVNRDIGNDFMRSQGSLGFGQEWAVGLKDALRWELRLDQTFGNGDLQGAWLTNYQALVGYSWGIGEPADFDGDGVPNRIDQCPNTPHGAKVDTKGCPIDTDGDGVYDGLDMCPGTPAGMKVNDQGCPLDTDGDGVTDDKDKCPNTPAGEKVNADGCPLDTDGDGVPDSKDACPTVPAATADGCPPPAPVAAPEPPPAPEKLVLEGVNFDNNSATLRPDANEILDKAAATLQKWGDVKVEVSGYTDSNNTDAYNLELSDRRANAVRDYLISKGVDATRLTAKGYGETNPIADNNTAEGRAKNRRVELVPQQ